MRFPILTQAASLKRLAGQIEQQTLDQMARARATRREATAQIRAAERAQTLAKNADDKARLRKALGYSD